MFVIVFLTVTMIMCVSVIMAMTMPSTMVVLYMRELSINTKLHSQLTLILTMQKCHNNNIQKQADSSHDEHNFGVGHL